MDYCLNLHDEPTLRETFQYRHESDDAVLIDRRTRWGNPFRVGRDGTREQVIALYRRDLWRRIRSGEIALEELAELHGQWLACWCEPQPCHGHVLTRAAAWAASQIDARNASDCPST